MLTYTLTWMSLSSNWHKFWLEEKEAWKVFLVWRKVQKGTFKHNTYVIKHHELSTQVLLMTRNWNQTKNNSNLRHIATGHLRTYKSRNLSEAIATVRIGRDKKHIYTYVYIWTSLKDCTRITKLKPFSAQSWDMGSSDHIKRNETNWTLLDVLCLLWIPSLKYRKLKFHSKRIKHFASQVFSVVPHFLQLCSSSFFFRTAQSSEAFWNWKDRMQKLLCTQETTQTILSTFHATANQQHCRERVLCSTKVNTDHWNPIAQELPKVLSSSLLCCIPWSKRQGHLGYLWKRGTSFRPSDCATNALPRTLHTFPSGQLDAPLKRFSKNLRHCQKHESQKPQSHLLHWGQKWLRRLCR